MARKTRPKAPRPPTPRPQAPQRRAGQAGRPRWLAPALLAAAALALVAGYAFIIAPALNRGAPGAGTEPGLVTKVESLYNDIYLYREPTGFYTLAFGAKRRRYVESIVDPKDELALPVAYTRSMVAGALAYPANLNDAAIIGLGGGRTAWYLHKSVPELKFTAVELDPAVADIADRYFHVRPETNFSFEIRDGRVFLARTDKTFDVILIDAYRGPFVPFHLLTHEFYKLVGEHLKPGGVAVQNVEPTTMLFDSAVATIKSAFDHVEFLSGQGNIVIVAYNGPEKDAAAIDALAAERQAEYRFRYNLPGLLANRYQPDWNQAAQPLTDDFAPVEYLKAIDRHNQRQP